ncbi:MAG: PD-(D/E)XK nuclease domain-containing protein, partial [Chlamydiia bacterium]|nr:PD-(D/E)XK nuclease domain-containing protein [Chlamydiia bacterium]
ISSLEEIDAKALMYQTGYFTVQGYNEISARYQLGLPNKEVRTAFMISLVKHFTKTSDVRSSEKFIKALEEYRLDFLFDHIKAGFASFAYQVFAGAKERTYQAMLLAMFYGMGFDPLSEKSTNTGRIDVALEMPKTTFILELKLDGSAENALCQIRDKAYFSPYLHKEKEVALIGANFSSEKRNVSEWVGELLSSSGEKVRDLH